VAQLSPNEMVIVPVSWRSMALTFMLKTACLKTLQELPSLWELRTSPYAGPT